MVRMPAVAGQFYPDNPQVLAQTIDRLLPQDATPRPALGLLSPHAGYIYSGAIAADTFARVQIPDRVLVLGPNHHGVGAPAALATQSAWRTPLGDMPLDQELNAALLDACPTLAGDDQAHRLEHSLEVQVPFIQTLAPQARMSALCLSSMPLDRLLELGRQIGAILALRQEPVLLVASTDMSHYEPGEIAREKDFAALDRVLALDPAGLYQTVRSRRISMCGVLPSVVVLAAALELGAASAELVRYGNSGDVNGDQGEVVGYAGVIIS